MATNTNEGPASGARVPPPQVGGHGEDNTRKALIIVGAIFLLSLLALFYVYLQFPQLEPRELQYIKVPWDIDDAKQLGRVLDRYKDRYFYEVLLAVLVTYMFLQTFAIPGSISLSILSGFLFPFPLALALVCFCSATGASLCYVLSHFLGRPLIYKYFPERALQWSLRVNKHRGNLISYLLFLRMTPFVPNWFINITSPIIDVPLFPFWIGTFIGVAPPSFVAIQAGQTLYKLSASGDAWSWTSVVVLGVFAVLSLVPVMLQKRLKEAKTVSNSKRKRPRKSWSEENMARAINAINDKKMGWLKATKTFSVPHAALRREFNKIKDKDAASK